MQSDPINSGADLAGKTAGMIVDNGMLVMIGAVFLIGLGATLYLSVRYWNRKISGEYVPIDEIESWVKKNRPELVSKSSEELPDLRTHRFFTEATRQMRAAEGTQNIAERDLSIWTIRGYRDAILFVLDDAYSHKDGFDKFFGDAQRFRTKFDTALTEAGSAIKYRLVNEFHFPSDIFSKWQQERELNDELMTTMLDVASERDNSYQRVLSALDSQYARVMMTRRVINTFISKFNTSGYSSTEGATESTIAGRTISRTDGYPAALFERSRR